MNEQDYYCAACSLRISSVDLNPNNYMDLFQVKPKYAFKKGDTKIIHSRTMNEDITRIREFGYVCYTQDGYKEQSIYSCLEDFYDFLGDPSSGYDDLIALDQPTIILVLYVYYKNEQLQKEDFEAWARQELKQYTHLYKAILEVDWNAD